MRNNWKLSALVVGLGFVMAANVFGQASAINGEITGTVTDPSGAAVSGATVQISNTDTGFKQSTKTGETGLYRFTVLPLGTYEVEVQAAGFGTTRRTGIAQGLERKGSVPFTYTSSMQRKDLSAQHNLLRCIALQADERRLRWTGEAVECPSAETAILSAEMLSRIEGNVGVVAFSRTGDPNVGKSFEDEWC